MKYHIWKLGVVFTDNVSLASGKTRFCTPGWGMLLNDTGEQAGQSSRKGSEIACQRWRTLLCRGTPLSCASGRQMGFHWAILRPVTVLQHLNALYSHFIPRDEQKWLNECIMRCECLEKLLSLFCFLSLFSTLPGIQPCRSWATTTTSSLRLICWILQWASRHWGQFCHL